MFPFGNGGCLSGDGGERSEVSRIRNVYRGDFRSVDFERERSAVRSGSDSCRKVESAVALDIDGKENPFALICPAVEVGAVCRIDSRIVVAIDFCGSVFRVLVVIGDILSAEVVVLGF